MPRVALLLSLLFLPAAHALTVGPEIPLSAQQSGPAPFLRSDTQVASNGDGFLAVWLDRRASPTAFTSEVRAARVDDSGAVLDATGLAIAQNAGGPLAVASDGEDYLVAYACASATTCIARIDAETGGITWGARLPNTANPALASNGRSYLLAYSVIVRGSQQSFGAVEVGRDGSVVGRPFHLANGFGPLMIASNGKQYFVTWSNQARLSGVLASESAVAGDAIDFTNTPPVWAIAPRAWSVASNGDGFLVTWQQRTGSAVSVSQLRAQAVTREGVATSAYIVVPQPEITFSPRAAWTGSDYLVTYTNAEGDLRGVRLRASGELAAAPATISAREGREQSAGVASNAMSTLIVWEHQYDQTIQIEAQFSAVTGEPILVSRSNTRAQQAIAGAVVGAMTVVAWEELTGAAQRPRVIVQRLGANGHPLDGTGTSVHESDALSQTRPAIGGSLIAWVEREGLTSRVLAKRLGADGLPTGDPLVLGNASLASSIAIAFAGSTHLVVWSSAEGIVGRRVSSGGVLLDAALFAISSEEGMEPRVATDGSRFLVVWTLPGRRPGGCIDFCPWRSVNGTVVTRGGMVAGPPLNLAPPDASFVSLVWNGEEYVLFWWSNELEIAVPQRFRARRINRNGAPVGEIVTVDERMPYGAVAWTGSDYIAVGYSLEIVIGRLRRDFTIAESASVPHRSFLFEFAIVPQGARTLVAYQAPSDDRVMRAVGRWIGEDGAVTRRRSAGY